MFFLLHYRRSEFLGCLVVSIKSVLEENICGTFMLQPHSTSLAKPTPLITINEDKLFLDDPFTLRSQDNDDILKYLELGNEKNPLFKGRTPFTLSRIIQKAPSESFGLEIFWTKPPQISSVKNAFDNSDQLKRGDFIIFVGEKNVVSLSKSEVLALIEEHEDVMTLEIFRPKENKKSKDLIDSLAMQSTPVAKSYASSPKKGDFERMCLDFGDTPKSLCQFKPKLCFQSAVGDGVIV